MAILKYKIVCELHLWITLYFYWTVLLSLQKHIDNIDRYPYINIHMYPHTNENGKETFSGTCNKNEFCFYLTSLSLSFLYH